MTTMIRELQGDAVVRYSDLVVTGLQSWGSSLDILHTTRSRRLMHAPVGDTGSVTSTPACRKAGLSCHEVPDSVHNSTSITVITRAASTFRDCGFFTTPNLKQPERS